MSALLADATGMFAATLTTLCWLPQAVRLLRTRDTKAISLTTQTAFAAGIALWFAYGVMIGSWPVMISNAVTIVLVAAIITLKIVHG